MVPRNRQTGYVARYRPDHCSVVRITCLCSMLLVSQTAAGGYRVLLVSFVVLRFVCLLFPFVHTVSRVQTRWDCFFSSFCIIMLPATSLTGGARHLFHSSFWFSFRIVLVSSVFSLIYVGCVCCGCRIQYDDTALQCLFCLLQNDV